MPDKPGKAPAKPPKRPRKSRKSRTKEPPSENSSFTDLPSEVLALIASYLLPPTYGAQYGIAPPYERPYPGPLMITPGITPPGERFGSVPRGVMDVVNFARVCRLTMGAAGRAMASFGGSIRPAVKVEDKPGPSGTKEELRPMAAKFKQSYDDVAKKTLYIQIDHLGGANGEDARALILAHRTTLEELVFYRCPQSHFSSRSYAIEKITHRIRPLQLDSSEEALPKLRRLQVGPKMCTACSTAALTLVCGKRFFCRTHTASTGVIEQHWDTIGRYYGGWEQRDQEKIAAPLLTHLEVHTTADQHRDIKESPNVTDMLNRLDGSLKERLEVFTLWLRPLEMQWGGFRQQGTSSGVRGKSSADAQRELEEAVFGKKWTPAAVVRRQVHLKEKEAERLAKYKLFVKEAIPKPPKRAKEEDAPNDPKADEPKSEDTPDPVSNGTLATLADADPITKEVDVKSSPHPDGAHPLNGNEANGDAAAATTTPEPSDIYAPRKGGAQSYTAASTSVRELLEIVARELPNLAALRMLRSGTAMLDAVEGFHTADEYSWWLVAPLAGMANLRYLDLGLAVVGKREVGDFPLGISLLDKTPGTIKSRTPQQNHILALQTKKWNREVQSAVQDADKWRKAVIERFVLGKSALPATSEEGETDADGDDDSPAPAAASRWPSTLMSGFVYTVDLENRAKRRGVVIPWTKKVTVDSGETLEEVVWGDKQQVTL